MTNKISESTQVTLRLENNRYNSWWSYIYSFSIFCLQSDIQLAKELPKPPIDRTEYDLKDQLVRETIININEKVDNNSKKLDKIDEKLFEIINK